MTPVLQRKRTIRKVVTIEYYTNRPRDFYRAFALLSDGSLATQVFDSVRDSGWSPIPAPPGDIVDIAAIKARNAGLNDEGVLLVTRQGKIWVTYDCGQTWCERKGIDE